MQRTLDGLNTALAGTTAIHSDITMALECGKLVNHCGADVLDKPTARPLFKRWLKRTAKVKQKPKAEETLEEALARSEEAFQDALKKAEALRKRDGIE